MNDFKDDYIKKKFESDKFIPKKVDDIFSNFMKNNITNINTGSNKNTNSNFVKTTMNQATSKLLLYKRLNKYLSVAAVFLCVILVGTSVAVYNKPDNVENIDIVTTKSVIIKNKELQFSNEKILKSSENDLIKASIIDSRIVAIQFKQKYIDMYNLELSSEKQYEVTDFKQNIKDIFTGCVIDEKSPCIMLIMEDGTVQYIRIPNHEDFNKKDIELDFYSIKVAGLYNVVAFTQESKYFFNSNDLYYYINAIRKDGKKKCVELYGYNNWDSNINTQYENMNEKYIEKYYNSLNENVSNNVGNNAIINGVSNNVTNITNNKTNQVNGTTNTTNISSNSTNTTNTTNVPNMTNTTNVTNTTNTINSSNSNNTTNILPNYEDNNSSNNVSNTTNTTTNNINENSNNTTNTSTSNSNNSDSTSNNNISNSVSTGPDKATKGNNTTTNNFAIE